MSAAQATVPAAEQSHPEFTLTAAPRGPVWTTDDLDTMPETSHRLEILDGTLLVSPTPTNVHQTVAMRLGVALYDTCPEHLDVTQNVEVRISRLRSFVPDVLVVTAEAGTRRTSVFAPHEVVLAVEVASPSSRTLDAVTKATAYAEAGIENYWRVETEGTIVVHTYRLDDLAGRYVETGTHTDTLITEHPWPLRLPVSQVAPRRF